MRTARQLLLFLPWMYVLGYLVWQYFTPVAVGIQAREWVKTPSDVSASLTGWKLHRCSLVQRSGRGYIQAGGRWTTTKFDAEPANDGDHLGRTRMGRWSWAVPSDSSGTPYAVRAVVQYSCSGELQEFSMGPLIIK